MASEHQFYPGTKNALKDGLAILQQLVDHGPYERLQKTQSWGALINAVAQKCGFTCYSYSRNEHTFEHVHGELVVELFGGVEKVPVTLACNMRVESIPIKEGSKRMKEVGSFHMEDAYLSVNGSGSGQPSINVPASTPLESIQHYLERRALRSLKETVERQQEAVKNTEKFLQIYTKKLEEAEANMMVLPENCPRIVVG
jgi:hypothetical protein